MPDAQLPLIATLHPCLVERQSLRVFKASLLRPTWAQDLTVEVSLLFAPGTERALPACSLIGPGLNVRAQFPSAAHGSRERTPTAALNTHRAARYVALSPPCASRIRATHVEKLLQAPLARPRAFMASVLQWVSGGRRVRDPLMLCCRSPLLVSYSFTECVCVWRTMPDRHSA